jgi:hypothetical protein
VSFLSVTRAGDLHRYALGKLFEDGATGVVERDFAKAVSMYNASAAKGNATAQFTMGVLYAHGVLGVPYDEARALLHYYVASMGGSHEAQLALAYVCCVCRPLLSLLSPPPPPPLPPPPLTATPHCALILPFTCFAVVLTRTPIFSCSRA